MLERTVKLLMTTFFISLIIGSISSLQRSNSISLRTDKKVYKIGEKVTIILENYSNRTIYLRNSAPWRIEKKLGNKWSIVFIPIALQVITPLSPGSSKKWIWPQRNREGKQVSEGKYKVVLTVNSKVLEAYFEIREDSQKRGFTTYFIIVGIIVLIIILIYVIIRHRTGL